WHQVGPGRRQADNIAVAVAIDLHADRVLDTALVHHAGEHCGGRRAAAEAGGGEADLGVWIFFDPFFSLHTELVVHLLHARAVAVTQSAVRHLLELTVLGADAGLVAGGDIP